MNAHCIILQMANKSAYAMFGYTKVSDLIGKNVNVLIPPPFSDQHNSYIKTHLSTGGFTIFSNWRAHTSHVPRLLPGHLSVR